MAAQPLPAYKGDEAYIFVTYSHADTDLVFPQVRWLQDQGFNVGWDEGISPGAVWRGELAQAIRGCSLLVFFTTPNSVASEHCTREVNFALDEHHRPVLAVHLQETALPDALALSLSDRQAILQHSLAPDDYERKLLSAVATYLNQPVPDVSSSLRAPSNFWRRKSSRQALIAVGCSIFVGAIAVIGTWFAMRPDAPELLPTARFEVQLPPGVQLVPPGSSEFGIDKTGTRIFVVGSDGQGSQAYVRDLNASTFTPISGTRATEVRLIGLFPSPRGKTLALGYADGMLRRTSASGGQPTDLTNTGNTPFAFYARWTSDSSLLLQDQRSIKQLSITDPTKVGIVSLVDPPAAHPHGLPDGSALLYTHTGEPLDFAKFRIRIKSLTTGEDKLLLEGSDPRVTPSRHLLFYRDGAVWATRLDVAGLAVTGEPFIVLQDVAAGGGKASYEFSDTGTLVYLPKQVQTRQRLVWLSREGVEKATIIQDIPLNDELSFSPDRTQFAFTTGNLRSEVWTFSFITGLRTLLADAIGAPSPIWFPDRRGIAFSSMHAPEKSTLYSKDSVGGESRHLVTADRIMLPRSVMPDGAALLVDECADTKVDCDIGIVPVDPSQDAHLIVGSRFNEFAPSVSPDGRYLAYSTDEFGPRRIVIRPFSDLTGAYILVPKDNCDFAHWSPRQDELFVGCEDGFFALPIEDQTNLTLGQPNFLFTSTASSVRYDPTRQQFLAVIQSSSRNKLVVVMNWFTELEGFAAAAER